MKQGADPVAEDHATAIMWITATLFLIPVMFFMGSFAGFGMSERAFHLGLYEDDRLGWLDDIFVTYSVITAIVPAAILVIGDTLRLAAIRRKERAAPHARTGLLIGLSLFALLGLTSAVIELAMRGAA